jgi:hypothetical protein
MTAGDGGMLADLLQAIHWQEMHAVPAPLRADSRSPRSSLCVCRKGAAVLNQSQQNSIPNAPARRIGEVFISIVRVRREIG